MGFRTIRPKRVKKVKTENGQEVLRRIEDYLKSDVTGEPVEILCGFWQDQQEAVTYQELRQAVRDGAISQETLRLWAQDYSILVTTKLSSLWTKAVAAGTEGQPILDNMAFEINMQSPGILNWLSERGAEFVTVSTHEQKKAIAALLTKKMRDGHTVDELSRLIRPCIGLTEGDAKAVVRLYDSIVSNLRSEHPRMKAESIKRKAMDAAQKYAERKHRQRAMTIAQTESAFAYNRGADEGIRQAQMEGYLGKCKKRWSTSGDDAVCELCSSLEGIEVDMDSDFNIGSRILFEGQHMLPPAHPRCACAIEYIESVPAYRDRRLYIDENEEESWYEKNVNYIVNEMKSTKIKGYLVDNGMDFDEVLSLNDDIARKKAADIMKRKRHDMLEEMKILNEKYKGIKYDDFSLLNEIDKLLLQNTLNQSSFYQKFVYATENGGKLPQIVDVLPSDCIKIYRGVKNAPNLTAEFINNATKFDNVAYIGNGVYGDGIYFSSKFDRAEKFAKESGNVINAALSKDASIIDYDSINEEMINAWKGKINNMEVSVYARLKGYDAITMELPDGEIYYNIINRRCLLIEES